jgi:hypothetical protein
VIVTFESGSSEQNSQQLILQALQTHLWTRVFVEYREAWGKQLNTFMFGHANLEMLLQPFIGLTGKWIAVEVEQGFSELSHQQQLSEVDDKLEHMIKQQDLFSQKKPLFPLPLLGIPGVWNANENAEFYANTDYFRPAPRSRIKPKLTNQ